MSNAALLHGRIGYNLVTLPELKFYLLLTFCKVNCILDLYNWIVKTAFLKSQMTCLLAFSFTFSIRLWVLISLSQKGKHCQSHWTNIVVLRTCSSCISTIGLSLFLFFPFFNHIVRRTKKQTKNLSQATNLFLAFLTYSGKRPWTKFNSDITICISRQEFQQDSIGFVVKAVKFKL